MGSWHNTRCRRSRYRRVGIGQGAAVATYAEILRDTYGADEVWPLVDIASGTDIHAFINGNRDGTLTGWDLQNAAGPVTGTSAPYSDGANDIGDIQTANGSDGLADIFDGDTGSLFMWGKVDGAGIWTDGARHLLSRLVTDGNNYLQIQKATNNGEVQILYRAGSVNRSVTVAGLSTTDWFSTGMSWDINAGLNGEMKAFWNGAQSGLTQTGLGVWAGALTGATIGAIGGPANVWDGLLAYVAVKFGSAWSPADFAAMHAAAATAGAD